MFSTQHKRVFSVTASYYGIDTGRRIVMPTTKDSVFRKLAEQEISKHGLQQALTSPAFQTVITKTVILEQGKSKATYLWYDKDGGIVAEHQVSDRDTDVPMKIGHVEVVNARAEYLRNYNRKTRHYHLRMTEHDRDVIDWLDHHCENIQGYIKSLIRKDMKEHENHN